MNAHPLAALFPLLAGPDLEALAADIGTNGLAEPIVLLDGQILDGRNRHAACSLAGVDPSFSEYVGADPAAWVVSKNLHRRHLSESQRAMVASRLAGMGRGKPSVNRQICRFKTQPEAAELLNVAARSVGSARVVQQQGVPELVDAVDSGGIAVSRAAEIARMPDDEQRAAVSAPHVSRNSGQNEWYTPAAFVAAARECMGGIDTDPASSEIANGTVGASVFYTVDDDGLSMVWAGRVWMNPPYSQPLIARFCAAVADKYDTDEIDCACVLVNNATETAWFQRLLKSAVGVCFPKGRIRFIDPTGRPSGAPLQGQAIVYMGRDLDAFGAAFRQFGGVLHVA